jgi:hypothetical protein
MMTRLLTTLACLALLPGAALANAHHHKRHKVHHHKRQAASAVGWDAIADYEQTAGFGGPLTLSRTDGTLVKAYFGEKAALRCGPDRNGPFTTCDKSNLDNGTPVAEAEHGVNQYGYDVWTTIDLVVEHPTTLPPSEPAQTEPPAPQEPAPQQPAPEQHAGPTAQAVVDAFDAGTGTLALHRLNNDEKPTGHVSGATSINCVWVKAGEVDHTAPCGTDALTPGTQLAGYAMAVVDGVPTFTKLYVLYDEGS